MPSYLNLFIIVAEILNVAFKNVVRISLINVISLLQFCSQQIISQYMDNTSLIVREEENTMDNLLEVLHNFGIAFGLEIYWHKIIAY